MTYPLALAGLPNPAVYGLDLRPKGVQTEQSVYIIFFQSPSTARRKSFRSFSLAKDRQILALCASDGDLEIPLEQK
jgi:hypothetical protein